MTVCSAVAVTKVETPRNDSIDENQSTVEEVDVVDLSPGDRAGLVPICSVSPSRRNESGVSTSLFAQSAERDHSCYLGKVLTDEFEFTVGGAEGKDPPDMMLHISTSGKLAEKTFAVRLCENKYFAAFFMALTFYALFVPDLGLIYADKDAHEGITITTTVVFVMFIVEIVIQCFGKKGYFGAAYFWLDLVAGISLLPETFVLENLMLQQNTAAGRSTRLTRIVRVASRSSKAARLNRLTRIVRVAALVPRIQRLFGSGIKDDQTDKVLDKKLARIFQFLDEDMDGCISKQQVIICLGMVRSLCGTVSPGTWAPKVNLSTSGLKKMVTSQMSSVRSSVQSEEEQQRQRSRNRERTNIAVDNFANNIDFKAFKDYMTEDDFVKDSLRRACRNFIKRSNNMQNITTRNSEYIGVKVALSVLFLLFILTLVETSEDDKSCEFGLESIDSLVIDQFGDVNEGELINETISSQIDAWSQNDVEWGTPRKFLYLAFNRRTLCGEHMIETPCWNGEGTWGPPRVELAEIDRMREKLTLKLRDTNVRRWPGFWDRDITTEELDKKVTSIAVLDMRGTNKQEGWDAIKTTLVVIFIILFGITALTKDLTYLSKNLLKPLVELADEMESITRLQFAGVAANSDFQSLATTEGTSEVRLIRRTYENMKKGIKSWAKYVPWPVVQLLLSAGSEASIDVQEKEVSIYFSDIASFTTIVEKLPPEQSLLLLSRYFHDMSKIIEEYGGIVLEFIGDAIMAIYGAPVKNNDHATAAVKSAVAMLEALKGMNAWFAEKKLPEVSIRCGVHTGRVLVGNMGFSSRMKYGAVGEHSNIPGRLEELNKSYSTEMLISQATHSSLTTSLFVIRPVDVIQLQETQGATPEVIYQVMQKPTQGSRLSRRVNAAQIHSQGFAAYRLREFNKAEALFMEVSTILHDLNGEEDQLSSMMAIRCRSYIESPPSKDWDGTCDRSHL